MPGAEEDLSTLERSMVSSSSLLRPLRQRGFLLLLRQLQVLLTEKAEPRSLRSVLAARVAAAHVAFPTPLGTATGSSPVAMRSSRYRGADTINEHLGEALNQGV
jgi:hypothetical protein